MCLRNSQILQKSEDSVDLAFANVILKCEKMELYNIAFIPITF